MSTSTAPDAMERMTPFISATYESAVPKSVSSVTMVGMRPEVSC
jgi:hypothetical protein